jgi:hypothetical protein
MQPSEVAFEALALPNFLGFSDKIICRADSAIDIFPHQRPHARYLVYNFGSAKTGMAQKQIDANHISSIAATNCHFTLGNRYYPLICDTAPPLLATPFW